MVYSIDKYYLTINLIKNKFMPEREGMEQAHSEVPKEKSKENLTKEFKKLEREMWELQQGEMWELKDQIYKAQQQLKPLEERYARLLEQAREIRKNLGFVRKPYETDYFGPHERTYDPDGPVR